MREETNEDDEYESAVVLDLDGTAFVGCLEIELVKYLRKQGLLDPDLYEDPIRLEEERRLRRVTHKQMIEAFVRVNNTNGFAGLPVSVMREAADELIDRIGGRMYSFTRELIAAAKQHRFLTVAISGSASEVVVPFCKRLDIDVAIGSEYPQKDGYYVPGPAKHRAAWKYREMRRVLKKHGIDSRRKCVIAIGDTVLDFPMLRGARYPIAFEPNGDLIDKLCSNARVSEWPIAIVRDSKDAITISGIAWDEFGAPYERNRYIFDILPPCIARSMIERLRNTLKYHGNLSEYSRRTSCPGAECRHLEAVQSTTAEPHTLKRPVLPKRHLPTTASSSVG